MKRQRFAEFGYAATVISEQYPDEFMVVKDCKVFSLLKKYKPCWNFYLIQPDWAYQPAAVLTLIGRIYAAKQFQKIAE